MKAFKWILFATMAAAIVLPGAALTAGPEKIRPSGFLNNYDEFIPDATRPGVFKYEAQGFDPKNYNKFIFQGLEIWLDENSEYKGINADKLKALSDRLLEAITDEFDPDYPLVRKPGPGVGLVRMALTHVYLQKGKWKWYNYTPVGAAAKGVQTGAGKHIRLSSAQFEVEMLDSQTGQRMGALVAVHAGEKLRQKTRKGKKNPETTWKDIEDTLEVFAKRFRQRLDERRGK